jgi:hypothetical protein
MKSGLRSKTIRIFSVVAFISGIGSSVAEHESMRHIIYRVVSCLCPVGAVCKKTESGSGDRPLLAELDVMGLPFSYKQRAPTVR